jgi:LAO/AO transport system ATPase
LLSLFARGEPGEPLLERLGPAEKQSRVIAVTGGGGVGKSTLVGKLIEHLRGQGVSVAVLACDPQSPLSGGALLGDRFRMPSRPDDAGVFIRSLAAPSGRGAIADSLEPMIRLLERFGFDAILIETAGAGQGDVAVHQLADTVLLLLQPETGDDLQWEKAGVLEVADAVVIHKADLPGADEAEAQVKAMLALSQGTDTPVLQVSAKTGRGVTELWQVLASLPLRRAGRAVGGGELLRAGHEELARRFAAAEAEAPLAELLRRWRAGSVERAAAADELLRMLATSGATASSSAARRTPP